MDQEPQASTASDIEVSSLRARRPSGAPMRRLAISGAVVLLALLVVFAGLAGLPQAALGQFIIRAPTHTPTRTPTPALPEPTFLTTDLAVLAPSPAHAGDAVTVVIRPQAAYDGPYSMHAYDLSASCMLYGPFASLAALQDVVASSRDGPPSGPGLSLSGPLFTRISAGQDLALTDTFNLPRTLSPGFYDFALSVTLRDSRAAARTDVPLQIVAGG